MALERQVADADVSFSLPVTPVGVFFTDNFESGDLTNTGGGFSWTGSKNTSVSTDNPRTGTYSLRFFFTGTGTSWVNSNAEQSFAHSDIPEVFMRFYLYLPDGNESYGGVAYRRTTTAESGFTSLNHKFCRLWDNNFGYTANPEKMGASTWPLNIAQVSVEYSETDGGPLLTHYFGNIFESADLGQWTEFQVNAKIETSLGAADGHFKIWKSGSLLVNDTGLTNYASDRNHIFNAGYLLGAANRGFQQDTILFIDDYSISTEFIT